MANSQPLGTGVIIEETVNEHDIGVVDVHSMDDYIPQANEEAEAIQVKDLDWLYWFARQLWPNLNNFARKIAKNKVEPEIDKTLDALGGPAKALKGVHFTTVDLGSKLPVFGPVRAYRRSKEDFYGIEVDCEMKLDCNPTIEMVVGGVKLGIKRLRFEGTVSVIFKPLVDEAPIIGGAQMFLLNRPHIDFELSGSLDVLNGNGMLHRVLRQTCTDIICKAIVLPHRVHLQVIKEWKLNTDIVSLSCPAPMGVCRLTVKGARDLPGGDVAMSDLTKVFQRGALHASASDPYTKVSIGAQTLQTPTLQKTLNPDWKEDNVGDFFVFNLRQDVSLEVYDDDFGFSSNDLLCRINFPIFKLLQKKRWIVHLDLAEGITYPQEPGQEADANKNRKPTLELEVAYFALGTPQNEETFLDFRKAEGEINEGLIGVKAFGIRPMGPRTDLRDSVGMVVRMTRIGPRGEAVSSSKPAKMNSEHITIDGLNHQVLKMVRNLRTLQPQLTDKQIAEAAEIDENQVRDILNMHSLMPVSVNAGFFFLLQDIQKDIIRLELLEAHQGEKTAKHPVAAYEVPMEAILAEQDCTLKKHILMRRGEGLEREHEEKGKGEGGVRGFLNNMRHTFEHDKDKHDKEHGKEHGKEPAKEQTKQPEASPKRSPRNSVKGEHIDPPTGYFQKFLHTLHLDHHHHHDDHHDHHDDRPHVHSTASGAPEKGKKEAVSYEISMSFQIWNFVPSKIGGTKNKPALPKSSDGSPQSEDI
eukprot:TRINITY_DN111174_c0_g1_i1.p1 TRINITY_DN111174_c0_g1~~TRINITY_DN111174_c0_g1_i1.p1  ORF type:complete len:851 (-),score=209.40 TRINITY_DN111174_c0_g1_i1:219-2474(-)